MSATSQPETTQPVVAPAQSPAPLLLTPQHYEQLLPQGMFWTNEKNIKIIAHAGWQLLKDMFGVQLVSSDLDQRSTFQPLFVVSKVTFKGYRPTDVRLDPRYMDPEKITSNWGEASSANLSNGISKQYPVAIAYKRGHDRALKDHLGLYDIYSEEESDDFRRNTSDPASNGQPNSEPNGKPASVTQTQTPPIKATQVAAGEEKTATQTAPSQESAKPAAAGATQATKPSATKGATPSKAAPAQKPAPKEAPAVEKPAPVVTSEAEKPVTPPAETPAKPAAPPTPAAPVSNGNGNGNGTHTIPRVGGSIQVYVGNELYATNGVLGGTLKDIWELTAKLGTSRAQQIMWGLFPHAKKSVDLTQSEGEQLIAELKKSLKDTE